MFLLGLRTGFLIENLRSFSYVFLKRYKKLIFETHRHTLAPDFFRVSGVGVYTQTHFFNYFGFGC